MLVCLNNIVLEKKHCSLIILKIAPSGNGAANRAKKCIQTDSVATLTADDVYQSII